MPTFQLGYRHNLPIFQIAHAPSGLEAGPTSRKLNGCSDGSFEGLDALPAPSIPVATEKPFFAQDTP